jgi:hypothetical protein
LRFTNLHATGPDHDVFWRLRAPALAAAATTTTRCTVPAAAAAATGNTAATGNAAAAAASTPRLVLLFEGLGKG